MIRRKGVTIADKFTEFVEMRKDPKLMRSYIGIVQQNDSIIPCSVQEVYDDGFLSNGAVYAFVPFAPILEEDIPELIKREKKQILGN